METSESEAGGPSASSWPTTSPTSWSTSARCCSLEGFDVAGTGLDADSAVQLVHRLQPDVALLDLRMPGGGPRGRSPHRVAQPGDPHRDLLVGGRRARPPPAPAGRDRRVRREGLHPRPARRRHPVGRRRATPTSTPPSTGSPWTSSPSRLHAEEQDALQQMRRRDRITRAISSIGYRIVAPADRATCPPARSGRSRRSPGSRTVRRGRPSSGSRTLTGPGCGCPSSWRWPAPPSATWPTSGPTWPWRSTSAR